jgi:hypothetical protein
MYNLERFILMRAGQYFWLTCQLLDDSKNCESSYSSTTVTVEFSAAAFGIDNS